MTPMNNHTFPTKENSITLKGPAGELEAITLGPDTEPKGLAIICHPHPQFEGTMHNKVVTTLARTLCAQGYAVVRFNFRGVGKSAGSYGEGKGEVEDLISVIKWAREQCPNKGLWLAGFSFGAYIVAKTSQTEKVSQLILVAPPVHYSGFAELTHFPCPVLIIQGETDEIVAAENVKAWVDKITTSKKLILLPDVTHFFHGKLDAIKKIIQTQV